MVEYWSIKDIIKHVVGSGIYKVGDVFCCASKVNLDWDNYFMITRINRNTIFWRMTEIRDRKTNSKIHARFVGMIKIEKFNEGIKSGRFKKV